jgi:pyruvate formate lyase activating enzyme
MAKFSLVDYPGKLSCVLFTGGCNFRCPYCQNPYLVIYEMTQPKISEREVFAFLESRKRKLDAVVISGGEPTLRGGAVAKFAEKVKDMGYLVKLDTNSSFPDKVIEMVDDGLVDMLGIDYKAPAAKYAEVAGVKIDDLAARVAKLIRHALDKNIPCDIRTTVHKRYHSESDLRTMRDELNELNVGKWCLQQFHKVEVIDETLLDEPTYTDTELQTIADNLGNGTYIRGV